MKYDFFKTQRLVKATTEYLDASGAQMQHVHSPGIMSEATGTTIIACLVRIMEQLEELVSIETDRDSR